MRIAVLHQAVSVDAAPDERDVLAQVGCVCAALAHLGHETAVLEADLDLGRLARELARLRPALAFNLVESLGGHADLLHLVPALLRSLRLPFTGSDALALALSTDKWVARARLSADGLPVPPAFRGDCAGAGPGRYLLKPRCEDASVGLDDASLIEAAGARELAEALRARAERLGIELFAEAWIEGREFNLSLLAKPGGVEVLPAAEILFEGFPAGKPRMVGYAAKWRPDSFEYRHTPRRFDLPAGDAALCAELARLARGAWAALGVEGWARVDFRVDAKGSPWILELNANPCLAPDAGFQAAVARAGLGLPDALERICAAARERGRA
jgi:D-alanine-D-alanine ligase